MSRWRANQLCHNPGCLRQTDGFWAVGSSAEGKYRRTGMGEQARFLLRNPFLQGVWSDSGWFGRPFAHLLSDCRCRPYDRPSPPLKPENKRELAVWLDREVEVREGCGEG